MSKQPKNPDNLSHEEKLTRFQEEHFGELCERLRLLLAGGQVDSACKAVRQFAAEQEVQPLTPGTSVQASGLSIRLANTLEQAGYQTLGSLKGLTEEELLGLRNCAEGAVEEVRSVLREMVRQQKSLTRGPQVGGSFAATTERVVPAPREYRGVKSSD